MIITSSIAKNHFKEYTNKETKLSREVRDGKLIQNKLIESNYITFDTNFNIQTLKDLLIKKFAEIDYKEAKEDVIPFIKDIDSLNIWSKEFFIDITEKVRYLKNKILIFE